MKQLGDKKVIIIAGAVIAVLLAVIGVLGWKYAQADKSPEAEAKTTTARVLKAVGELYLLPTDEEPTVAQVQDKSKLDNKEFFKSTEDGDYLLLYKKNKLALVYRESTDKIITVGPINLDSGQTAGEQTEKPAP